jgi:murein DD-endopeptidase MepM/ murein hydrolase activator NlpD
LGKIIFNAAKGCCFFLNAGKRVLCLGLRLFFSLGLAPCPASFMDHPYPQFIRHLFFLIAVSLVVAGCWLFKAGKPPEESPVLPPVVVPPPGQILGFPTPQTRLNETNNPAVFMPTAAGKVESARYGSARTRVVGTQYLAAFHEGVDIASIERDAKGRALDPVFAVTEGRIGYVNRVAGNSSYGIYVVVLHSDPLGEYYTLYAHLTSASAELKAGDPVARGQKIGQIGNTSTLGIPVQRSHLHFEFGLILNDRFGEWFNSKKLKPYHGRLHGYNLAGLNPESLFSFMAGGERFVMQHCVTNTPVAFRWLLPVTKKPDYYVRYPSLWSGEEPCGAMVVAVSEGGVPLQARAATADEVATLQKNKPRVLEAFPDVLGRNGPRLVVQSQGSWILGRNADRWMEILLYP